MSLENKVIDVKLSSSVLMVFRVIEDDVIPYLNISPVKVNEAVVQAFLPDKNAPYEVRFVAKVKIVEGRNGGMIKPLNFASVKVTIDLFKMNFRWGFVCPTELFIEAAGVPRLKLKYDESGKLVLANPADHATGVALRGFILDSLGGNL